MKKKLVIIVVIVLVIIGFLYYSRNPLLNMDEALKVGEEKYLKFLWMIDGAFNDERMGYSLKVNNHKLKDEDKSFKCIYQKDKKSCVATNFENEFKKVFSSSITYKNVYSDGISNSWYEKKNDKYIFTNVNTCNVGRMSEEQILEVNKIEPGKITYNIKYLKNEKEYIKTFILVYEENDWKVKSTYYHDLCKMSYIIR